MARILNLIGLVGLAIFALWLIWRSIKQAEDPGRITFKWFLTAIIFVALVWMGLDLNRRGRLGAFVVAGSAAGLGVLMGIIWAPQLGAALAKPFTSFYDGGSQEVEERPFYAIARAKQKRGNYPDAITEIRKQLLRFPEDYEGWMFLAEIYANDLKDNEAAQQCIQEILSHSDHAAKNIAFALNRSADWYLGLIADREQARTALEEILRRFPETELAHAAAQRIAHLTTDQMLADQKERPKLVLTHHEGYLGLQGQVADPRPPAEDPGASATRLLSRLNEYPEDVEAREELSKIYADHFERIDLASDQIEQLLVTPGSAAKEVARWLNMLADFHVKLDQDKKAARAALERIITLYPKSAVAAKAETRIAYLDTEMLKNKKSQAIRLGSAEENMGLKGGWPST